MKNPQDSMDQSDSSTAPGLAGDDTQDASTRSFDYEVPKRIGRYQIIRPLGQGGFGSVYLASDPDLHRQVAVKVPRRDRPISEDSIERYLKEGKMLARINHPSIVAVHDIGRSRDGIPFVVMEYVEGRDLGWILKQRELSTETQLEVLIRVAGALQQAHKQGIVHRDFKPSNVILDQREHVHLVDFGLALHDEITSEDLESTSVAGTPSYMAPEQIRGENHLLDGRTDIWAFGVTIYRMFSGVLPFRVKNPRRLLHTICYKDPTPIRQLNESTPKEIERICLRCLEKLMADRYPSMADVIDELRSFQSTWNSKGQLAPMAGPRDPGPLKLSSTVSGKPRIRPKSELDNSIGAASPTTSGSVSGSLAEIVPKGLRQFDQSDKSFFFGLLPGPVDRIGTPESIRFWTNRLGLVEQVDCVPFGIIYGPSGSGKSSFVRAGLLPSLPEQVAKIYVDCTGQDPAKNISKKLTRAFEGIEADKSLPNVLRQIRNGQSLKEGKKLLLILDQFEQWLTRNNCHAQHELTEALRQCDGERVQALILIRDEFWLSMSEYLKLLGQSMSDGHNAMPLPLFDKRHARKVLTAIGRALKTLPDEHNKLSRSQRAFITEAVDSLAISDRVICVHLSVFVETTKHLKWELSQFKSRGGMQGIARDYIAGIFGNPETPAFIKRHSREAWAILVQLLPATRSSLKGALVSKESLYRNCSPQIDRRTFEELTKFLELDCNLISRVESPESIVDSTESNDVTYGLTHDFLVSPIREWGNAKQNESPTGRATAHLVSLADQWEITYDRRFMPSFSDFIRFIVLVDSSIKSKRMRYWNRAKKSAITRLAFASAIACFLCFVGFWGVLANQDRLDSRLKDLLLCNPEEFPTKMVAIQSSLPLLAGRLLNESEHENPDTRFRANCVRLIANSDDDTALSGVVADLNLVSLNECGTLATVLEHGAPDLKQRFKMRFESLFATAKPLMDDEKNFDKHREVVETRIRSCCRLAIQLAFAGDVELLSRVMQNSGNPQPRAAAIVELSTWHLEFSQLLSPLISSSKKQANPNLLSGIINAIGLNELADRSTNSFETMTKLLLQVYRENDNGGVHFASWYALSKIGVTIPNVSTSGSSDCEWRHLEIATPSEGVVEIPMVRIPAGTYISEAGSSLLQQAGFGRSAMTIEGSYPDAGDSVLVENSFWISAIGLRNGDFLRLLHDRRGQFLFVENYLTYLEEKKELAGAESSVSNSTNLQACYLLANVISSQLNLPQYYTNVDSLESIERRPNGGVRLPTERELEHAIRCGSETRYYVGNDETLAKLLIGHNDSIGLEQITDYPPNAFGLFGGGFHSERIDKLQLVAGELSALYKGGITSPSLSSEVRFRKYTASAGSCRLVIDEMPEM